MPLRIRGHVKYPAKQQAVAVEPKPPRPKGVGWTPTQDEILKAHFLLDTAVNVAGKVGKTAGQVYARAYQLGLQKSAAMSAAQREMRGRA